MSEAGHEQSYMSSPEWSELVNAEVLGRPVMVWRRRPLSVNALLQLSVGRDDDDFLVDTDDLTFRSPPTTNVSSRTPSRRRDSGSSHLLDLCY